ncbi:hypothetical protein JXQ31_01170 [candidate division KSB1 bacterium]|nr:hypothetical protein [candidate division KSB1 bacterium]
MNMDLPGNGYFENKNILPLIRVSGIAALLQLIVITVGIVITAGLGPKPDSAYEYYVMMQESKFIGLLTDDFYSIILVSLYLFTFSGLFFVVMKNNFSLSIFATLLTFTAVILCISSHSGFSLMHLSDLYWVATDETTKSGLIAAGEAVIAQNIWNSSSAFFSGIFLQGGGVLISAAMLGDKNFRKLTIFSGFIANGLDLVQHLVHYFAPSPAEIILYIAGPFYIIWFLMLSLDLFKLVKLIKSH